MPERPATDPPKPGSKLAAQQTLGRPGLARQIGDRIERTAVKVANAILPRQPPPMDAPPIAAEDAPPLVEVIPPMKKRQRPIEEVKPRQGQPAATAEAKTAIAEALARATLKDDKPWLKMDPPISRSTYFNRKKAGTL